MSVAKTANECLVLLQTIEVLAMGCSCIPTLRQKLVDVKDIAKLAQTDHDAVSELSEEWVEVVCLADGLRMKIQYLLEQATALPRLDNVHPLIATALKPFVYPREELRRAA